MPSKNSETCQTASGDPKQKDGFVMTLEKNCVI